MKLTFKDFLKLKDLDTFSPEEICNILANIFETGREQRDKDVVQKGLELCGTVRFEQFDDHLKAIFHFFVSNGWSYLQKLTQSLNSDSFWAFDNKEIENQVIHLRKALAYVTRLDRPDLESQILTNMGNTFSHVGRFVEATQFWQRAMQVLPGFGMAIGNLGFGLAHYAKVLYDDGHRFLFCQFAYKYLVEASGSEDVYPEGQDEFRRLASIIIKRYGISNIKKIQNLKKFKLGSSKEEKVYRQWCINNRLFINPLNDFIFENVVGHDCFYLPEITLKVEHPPLYHSIYNQIKQEFVSVRFLFYEGLRQSSVHFSDKENIQMDTLDYSVYSFNTEKLKIVFRVCYSLFDKIAYLLNSYLNLGLSPNDVSFRKLWYLKKKNNKGFELNPIIISSQNWSLRGLFWLSKDLSEYETDFSKAILPEAQQIATIRNFIEHKSFKIVNYGKTCFTDNGLTFQINREEFEEKIYILMKMVRSAIMYLSFAIHIEEMKKNKNGVMQIPFYEFMDDYKM